MFGCQVNCCPQRWSKNDSIISKLFPFNCLHAYAYALSYVFYQNHYNISLSI